MPKFLFTTVAIGCLLTAACVQRVLESARPPGVPSEVPENYRAIYREIDAEIDRQLPLVPFPLPSQTKFASSVRKPKLESRLLYTGHRMASKQVPSMLFPEQNVCPGFDATRDLFRCFSHRFAFARLPDPYMT